MVSKNYKYDGFLKMKIELICTGSELLSGKLNTNAAYIGTKIFEMGFELSSILSIGDRKHDLSSSFKNAFKRSRVIITTGGLGPTFDDITVETVANCLNLEVYSDEKVLKHIKNFFLKQGITHVPKINEKQAKIIREAKILKNCLGTAPGQMLQFEFEIDKKKYQKTLFLLPGPPREMEPIFEKHVKPFLKFFFKNTKKTTILHVFNIPESIVDEIVRPIMNEVILNNPKLSIDFAILASELIVDIKFSISGIDEFIVNKTMNNLKLKFNNILKDNIFGTDGDTLANVVGRLLIKSRKTVAFAESCTGGMVAATTTEVPGSSFYFKTSVIAYSNSSKIKLLNVKKATLINFGSVSKETAEEMAKGILKFSGSDLGFSVTGIAGPDRITENKPIGLVYIGFASKNTIKSFKFKFGGTRKEIRKKITNTVLNLLRKNINN
jgi:nicotinamide-nucleotide amidase